MKTINYLLIFSFFASFNVYAQSTLTFENFYQQDVPITQHYLNANLESVGESGENITWDFSRLDYNPLALTVELKEAENTPYFNYFPQETHYNEANFCLAIYDGVLNTDYHYLLKTEESIEFLGNKSTDGVIELDFYGFQDRQKIFHNSMDYNELKVDEFEASIFDFSGSEWHYDKGVDSTHYDAYGTLVTPDGETLEDIIRIKETVYHRDSSLLGVQSSKEEKYFWYQKDVAYPIVEIQVRTFNGNTNPNPIAFYNPPPIVNNLEEKELEQVAVKLFPVPVNDILNVGFEVKNGAFNLLIYDVQGKLVKEEWRVTNQGENVFQLNLSSLKVGFYTILIETGERIVRRKFLKK